MTGSGLARAFAQLLDDAQRYPMWWRREMAELRTWPTDLVRVLWDLYDGSNSPLGFAGETIHAALNERGDGAYCAV